MKKPSPSSYLRGSYANEEGTVHVRTVDDILNDIGFGTFQVIVFFLCGFTCFALACDILTLALIGIEVSDAWDLDGVTFAILPSVTSFTNLLGSIVFSYWADRHGRRWPYLVSLAFVGLFALASAFAPSFIVFTMLRAVSSFGIGGMVVVFPTLIECLPIPNRGKVGVLVSLIQSLGNCASAGAAWWLIPSYNNGWRYFIMATGVCTLLVLVFRIAFFYESPRYLISKGKIQRAWEIFLTIAWFNGKDLTDIISQEQFELCFHPSVQGNEVKTSSVQLLRQLASIFQSGHLRQTVGILIIYNTEIIGFYVTTVFFPQILEILHVDAYLGLFTASCAQILGTLLLSIVTEWPEFGRLNTLRIFSAFTVIFFLLLAFIQSPGAVAIFIILIYFTMSPMIGLVILYSAESYPTEIRAAFLGLAGVLAAITGLWAPFVTGYVADVSSVYTWLFPLVSSSVFALQLLVLLFVLNHDTRGRFLQDHIN